MEVRTKTATDMVEPRPGHRQPRSCERKLTAEEIGSLAKRMVASSDPDDKAGLKEAIVKGFYGEQSDA
ncbi:MAG TPA: hypothetical protein VN765_00110 [Candidatus Acidoferrum sp.]|nr:hypothetical protein [Candidatus Acidoferrum sp.]